MLLTIAYCPEMNIYRVHNGSSMGRIVEPRDFGPGGRLEPLAPVFEQARDAVVSGRAIEGIAVEV